MKQIVSIFCILLVTSCTWIKDDRDDCPYGFWLNLHYTYNILNVEAIAEYMKDVSVYVYDANGNYVTRLDYPQTALTSSNYRIRIEGLPEGDYKFVVWSGLTNTEYAVSGDRNSIEQFRLALAGQSSSYSKELPALFYGYLDTVHYDESYSPHDVYMMKNTNQLACVVVTTNGTVVMDPSDYTMKIVTPNGTMNAYNQLVPDRAIAYEPFIKDTITVVDVDYGKLQGLKFSMMTLRLMEDTDCRLILENNLSGETIFDVSLPEYIGKIGALNTNFDKPLTAQEYLDRQDFYTVVFFLSQDVKQLIQVQVNNWRMRVVNHLKL